MKEVVDTADGYVFKYLSVLNVPSTEWNVFLIQFCLLNNVL